MVFGDKGLFPITRVGQSTADMLVGTALDAGVTLFDTADIYCLGQSEQMLGKALGTRRREVVLSSKVGNAFGPSVNDTGLSRRHILDSVDASLRRLGTDWLDLYIAHRHDPLTPLAETLEAFDCCVKSGKARYIGFSNWPAWLASKAVAMQEANGWARFVVGQMYYSLVGREAEHEIVPFFHDARIGMMVWSPLVRGFLAGRYDRKTWSTSGMAAAFSFNMDQGLAVVADLERIAAKHGTKPGSVALAWLLTRPTVSTLVFGATTPEQLSANIAALQLTLDPEDLAALDHVSAISPIYPTNLNQLLLASDARCKA
jgi:aryl-alcohol dehydrogenase-like predicted oxidoreductase